MLRLLLPAVLGLVASEPCEDPFDWSPGKHVPYDVGAQQRSISRIGDVRRFRPLLQKLSSRNATVVVLIIGASAVEDPAQSHPWSDVFCEWLRRRFAARITTSRLYLTGVLSQHLQVIPASAAMVKPDLVFVEISLTPLVRATKYSSIDQTPEYLVVETFMRSMLTLPGHPGVVWVDLMANDAQYHTNEDRLGSRSILGLLGHLALLWDQLNAEQYHTNEETDSILTEYYNVPQVSIRGAWHHRLPFPTSELWHGKHLSLLGHKLIAVTLANFMCFEFSQTCLTTSSADTKLPKALFSHSVGDMQEELALAANRSAGPGALTLAFCRSEGGNLRTAQGSASERLAWSLAVTLAVVPLGLVQLFAAFAGNGGNFVQNMLPQSMPELEFLRVVATVNIVAWQYYQELPPPWSDPGSGVAHICHDPYYDYPDWTRRPGRSCPHTAPCTWCRSGKYCFQFFFLLQAFVSTLNTVRTGPTSPIWQYAQVWPLHALSLLLAILAAAPVNPLDLALVASLAHSWITPFHSQLNGAAWYLSVLVGFWIVLPSWIRAADLLAASRGVSGVVAALAGAWLCTLLLPFLLYVWPVNFGMREVDPRMVIHNFVEYSPYANWQPVAIGLLLGVLVMLGIEPRTQAAVLGCLCASLVGLSIAWFVVPSPGFSMGSEYLLLEKGFALQPLFALLMLGSMGARHFPNAVHRALTGSVMLWLAKLCWPIFILHQPVHRFCTKVLFPLISPAGPPAIVYMLLYPLILVLLSAAASRFIDKPWTSFLYRYRSAAGARTATPGGRGASPPLMYQKVGGMGNDPAMSQRGSPTDSRLGNNVRR